MVQNTAETAANLIELVGIGVIALTSAWVLVYALYQFTRRASADEVFRATRQRLGLGILLGLEFLVAADIIHTVAIELTFYTVGVLAAIVLVRTFLSFTLDLELTGRWPWQHKGASSNQSHSATDPKSRAG